MQEGKTSSASGCRFQQLLQLGCSLSLWPTASKSAFPFLLFHNFCFVFCCCCCCCCCWCFHQYWWKELLPSCINLQLSNPFYTSLASFMLLLWVVVVAVVSCCCLQCAYVALAVFVFGLLRVFFLLFGFFTTFFLLLLFCTVERMKSPLGSSPLSLALSLSLSVALSVSLLGYLRELLLLLLLLLSLLPCCTFAVGHLALTLVNKLHCVCIFVPG